VPALRTKLICRKAGSPWRRLARRTPSFTACAAQTADAITKGLCHHHRSCCSLTAVGGKLLPAHAALPVATCACAPCLPACFALAAAVLAILPVTFCLPAAPHYRASAGVPATLDALTLLAGGRRDTAALAVLCGGSVRGDTTPSYQPLNMLNARGAACT